MSPPASSLPGYQLPQAEAVKCVLCVVIVLLPELQNEDFSKSRISWLAELEPTKWMGLNDSLCFFCCCFWIGSLMVISQVLVTCFLEKNEAFNLECATFLSILKSQVLSENSGFDALKYHLFFSFISQNTHS